MMDNVDPQELEKFESSAARWWDPAGEFKPLHLINPVRSNYINERAPVAQKYLLDVGCGGGLLCEALANKGAVVTGIDLGSACLEVARLHLQESKLQVDYQNTNAEAHAKSHPEHYDIVTCMELLEHVPDPESLVRACIAAAKPGGDIFFSTINRNLIAYLLAIVAAEYLFRLLPRGTHNYPQLIKPSELTRAVQRGGASVCDIAGIRYIPVIDFVALSTDPSVNYIMHCRKA